MSVLLDDLLRRFYLDSRKCIYNRSRHICDTELELIIAAETIREAEETFSLLRSDYHELLCYARQLESILEDHGIALPDSASLI